MAVFAFLPPLLLGLFLGSVTVWLILKNAAEHACESARARSAAESAAESAGLRATLESLRPQLEAAQRECADVTARLHHMQAENAAANANLDAGRELLASERKSFEESRQQFKAVFENAAAEILNKTSAALRQEMDANHKLTGQVVEQKQLAIDRLLLPIKESLGKLEQQSQQLEVKREGAYADIRRQIEAMQKSHVDLNAQTRQLVGALRNPKARGNWGEMQLKRCIDFAGMIEHCDFIQQPSTRTAEDNLLRPDVLVKLPNNRAIVIDAKTPLDAFLTAMSCPDTEAGDLDRKRLLQQHAAQLREHLKALDRKSYGREFARQGAPELVVCFLPSEVLLSSALEQDAALIEFSNTVVLATPTTLIALLKAISCGWQQMRTARDADHIREAALAVYAKLTTATDKIAGLGSSLKRAVGEYNNFLTTVQGRGGVFSLGRKLHDLSIGSEELEMLPPVEAAPTPLTHEAWASPVKRDAWIPPGKHDDWATSANGKLALTAAEDHTTAARE